MPLLKKYDSMGTVVESDMFILEILTEYPVTNTAFLPVKTAFGD